MSEPTEFGNFYWAVIRKNRTEMLWADSAAVVGGCLVFTSGPTETRPTLVTRAFAQGEWQSFGAASILDGRMLSVDSDLPFKSK